MFYLSYGLFWSSEKIRNENTLKKIMSARNNDALVSAVEMNLSQTVIWA